MSLLRRRVSGVIKKFVTLLYTDGTLMMNEDSSHRAANIAAHGAVVKEYTDFDYNTELINYNSQP